MADKLLKKNGWMIFDDYLWSYARADKAGRGATDGITHRKLSEAELNTPQIREVFQLLVMQHPDYDNFKIHAEGDWAWAQKTGGGTNKKVNIEYNLNYTELFKKIRKNIREKK